MFNWGALTTEVQGALTLIAVAAGAWMITKVMKGDVSGAAKILGSAVIALIGLGLVFIMAAPDTAQAIVSKFIG
jgi:hypothetical protein